MHEVLELISSTSVLLPVITTTNSNGRNPGGRKGHWSSFCFVVAAEFKALYVASYETQSLLLEISP
jgi:hypothetical protein